MSDVHTKGRPSSLFLSTLSTLICMVAAAARTHRPVHRCAYPHRTPFCFVGDARRGSWRGKAERAAARVARVPKRFSLVDGRGYDKIRKSAPNVFILQIDIIRSNLLHVVCARAFCEHGVWVGLAWLLQIRLLPIATKSSGSLFFLHSPPTFQHV